MVALDSHLIMILVALDGLYHGSIRQSISWSWWLSVPCGISNTQSVFQWYWTVCISVALDGLYLSDIGQPVSWWHWSACISVELNSLWLSENSLRDLMVLSTGCYTCTGVQLFDKTDPVMWYRHPVSVPQHVMLALEVDLENYVQLKWGAACRRQGSIHALSRSNEAILITQQKWTDGNGKQWLHVQQAVLVI